MAACLFTWAVQASWWWWSDDSGMENCFNLDEEWGFIIGNQNGDHWDVNKDGQVVLANAGTRSGMPVWHLVPVNPLGNKGTRSFLIEYQPDEQFYITDTDKVRLGQSDVGLFTFQNHCKRVSTNPNVYKVKFYSAPRSQCLSAAKPRPRSLRQNPWSSLIYRSYEYDDADSHWYLHAIPAASISVGPMDAEKSSTDVKKTPKIHHPYGLGRHGPHSFF